MKISRDGSLREVAFVVCTALQRGGIEVVLTGGSAATVYAPQAYLSRDIDFIVTFNARESNASDILASLGYRTVVDHYEHPDSELVLEFPEGPLAVGRTLIQEWDTMSERDMMLHIIKPTDSCRDRLAGFLFWSDRASLDQAVAVAKARRNDVDMEAIRRWCRSEGKADAFREFERALSAAG